MFVCVAKKGRGRVGRFERKRGKGVEEFVEMWLQGSVEMWLPRIPATMFSSHLILYCI